MPRRSAGVVLYTNQVSGPYYIDQYVSNEYLRTDTLDQSVSNEYTHTGTIRLTLLILDLVRTGIVGTSYSTAVVDSIDILERSSRSSTRSTRI